MTVTVTQCRSRHRWLVGEFTIGLGVLLGLVGWVGWWTIGVAAEARVTAAEAMAEADDSGRTVSNHIAASVERDKSIDYKLESIQATQLRMDKKLDAIALRP